MIIGLIGPPCAGKATVAAWLAATTGATRVDSVAELLSPRRAGLLAAAWRPAVHVVIRSVGGGELDPVAGLAKRPPSPFPRVRPALTILNAHAALPPLHAALHAADLLSPAHRRPPWDAYFMALARLAAARTNCMRRRVGAVVTVDRRIVSTGYNGTPVGAPNCADGGCERCNDIGGTRRGVGLELCVCLHAEENAIIEAGRRRCGGAVMYTTVFPCMACAKKIVQAGVRRVVYGEPYATDGQAARFLGGVGVELVAYEGRGGGDGWGVAGGRLDGWADELPAKARE